jgi:hypothetical protein
VQDSSSSSSTVRETYYEMRFRFANDDTERALLLRMCRLIGSCLFIFSLSFCLGFLIFFCSFFFSPRLLFIGRHSRARVCHLIDAMLEIFSSEQNHMFASETVILVCLFCLFFILCSLFFLLFRFADALVLVLLFFASFSFSLSLLQLNQVILGAGDSITAGDLSLDDVENHLIKILDEFINSNRMQNLPFHASSSSSSSTHKSVVEDTSTTDSFSSPSSSFSSSASKFSQFTENAVLVSLMLRGVATISSVLRSHFDSHLMTALYSLLSMLSRPHPLVHQAVCLLFLPLSICFAFFSVPSFF